jgi:mRNA interferase RelE/StbE
LPHALQFLPSALKEWQRVDGDLRQQFKNKLAERLMTPRVPADRLRGADDRYKIKLRAAGYRLVYSVDDLAETLTVVAVGRRDANAVYDAAARR